jgi:hypothetical protein
MFRLILKLVIIIICLGLISVNCKESNVSPDQSQGDITDYDNAPGPLIENGKLAITTNNGTVKRLLPFYLVYSDFLVNGTTRGIQFPVNARLNRKHNVSKLPTYIALAHLR